MLPGTYIQPAVVGGETDPVHDLAGEAVKDLRRRNNTCLRVKAGDLYLVSSRRYYQAPVVRHLHLTIKIPVRETGHRGNRCGIDTIYIDMKGPINGVAVFVHQHPVG